MRYEQYKVPETSEFFIKRLNDDESVSWIPTDEANSDYQAYLAWVAEGNEAEIVNPEELKALIK